MQINEEELKRLVNKASVVKAACKVQKGYVTFLPVKKIDCRYTLLGDGGRFTVSWMGYVYQVCNHEGGYKDKTYKALYLGTELDNYKKYRHLCISCDKFLDEEDAVKRCSKCLEKRKKANAKKKGKT